MKSSFKRSWRQLASLDHRLLTEAGGARIRQVDTSVLARVKTGHEPDLRGGSGGIEPGGIAFDAMKRVRVGGESDVGDDGPHRSGEVL